MVHDDERLDAAAASRLDGWKAIAAYLNRDVRTVKRWEAGESLPVHRHQHSARSSVYAFQHELDAWRAGRQPAPKVTAPSPLRRPLVLAAVLLAALISPGNGHVPRPPITAQNAPTEIFRKVWTGAGTISRDGRRVVYIDKNGNPVLHDVATSVDRSLTSDASYARSWATVPAISRHGDRVAYWWLNLGSDSRAAEIRDINLEGVPAPRTILAVNEDIYARDWSPDGKSIAIAGAHGISILSVVDGSRRRVQTLNGRAPDGVFFSPDGRALIAVKQARSRAGDISRELWLVPLDGVPTRLDVDIRRMPGPAFSGIALHPSGARLAFVSDGETRNEVWVLEHFLDALNGR